MSQWTKPAGRSRWSADSGVYGETASVPAVTDSGPDLAVIVGSLTSGDGIFKWWEWNFFCILTRV